MIALAFALVAAAAWTWLAVARGGFWRGRENDDAMHRALAHVPAGFAWPRVAAIVPARDEAALIASSVGSLLGQRYAGVLTVVVVDDHSEDGTAAVAERTAVALGAGDRLTVLRAPPLPSGWTGKLWSLATGVDHVQRSSAPPDHLLFMDADIACDADVVAALTFAALRERHVLCSLMARLHCESLAERALIPAFVFFFQLIYPFAWVNRADRATAAAGGCMLVDRQALAAAGGIAAIRDRLIDDCALGRRMKDVGRIHLALADRVRSLRSTTHVGPLRRMVVRSAFAQLDFSWARLGFVAVAMLAVFVAPVGLALAGGGVARALGAFAWALMAVLFAPTARRHAVSVLWGIALPAIATAYLAFTLESAVAHRRGRGGWWKGRAQAPHGRTSRARES